jgi:hypothetical protein
LNDSADIQHRLHGSSQGTKKRKMIWVLATSKTPSISWLLLRPSVLEVTNQIQKMHYIARQVKKVKDDDQNV